jgi:hypothetical protein
MASVMVMQGRQIGERDVDLVRNLLGSHPDWNRTRLSRELCARWNWHNAQSRPKDMAARSFPERISQSADRTGGAPRGTDSRRPT